MLAHGIVALSALLGGNLGLAIVTVSATLRLALLPLQPPRAGAALLSVPSARG